MVWLSVRKSLCFLLPIFGLGEESGDCQIFYSYFLKAPTNILIVKKIPLVAQILGKGFKQKTRKRGTLNNDQEADGCAVEQSLDVDCSYAPVSYENETSC